MNCRNALFLLPLFFTFNLIAQFKASPLQIPMRDGKTLAADLYHPDQAEPMPVILIQTPYNKNTFKLSGMPLGIKYNLKESNYAFVIVDWRGHWGSKKAGKLLANRGEDGFDTVEWIAKQPWCNGKIGTWGPSALGNIQFMTAKEHPSALVCAMPVVTSPTLSYSKYFPGGVLRLNYTKFLSAYFGTGNLIAANHFENKIWKKMEDGSFYPEKIEVPMLMVGGWFDHNIADCLVWIKALRENSPAQVRDKHKILIGPWTHNFVGHPKQAELRYEEAKFKNHELGLQFFDFYLVPGRKEKNQTQRLVYQHIVWEKSCFCVA